MAFVVFKGQKTVCLNTESVLFINKMNFDDKNEFTIRFALSGGTYCQLIFSNESERDSAFDKLTTDLSNGTISKTYSFNFCKYSYPLDQSIAVKGARYNAIEITNGENKRGEDLPIKVKYIKE